jgi:hypothetical protein
MWKFLRQLKPVEIAGRVPLINRRHLAGPKFAEIFSEALELVNSRMRGVDADSEVDGWRLFLCLYNLLFGRHRAGLTSAGRNEPWLPIVRARLDRLIGGDAEGLWAEAVDGCVFRLASEGVDLGDAKAKRAVELAHMGSVSNSFGALTSAGSELAVRDEFS